MGADGGHKWWPWMVGIITAMLRLALDGVSTLLDEVLLLMFDRVRSCQKVVEDSRDQCKPMYSR